MNFKEFQNKVKDLIKRDELELVISILESECTKHLQRKLLNEVTILAARLNRIREEMRKDLIVQHESKQELNNIRNALLEIVDALSDKIGIGNQLHFRHQISPENLRDKFEKSFVKDPGELSVWTNFRQYLSYFNAPFIYTDVDHITFKEIFLKKSTASDPAFKILFFTGITEKEKVEFELRMDSLKESVNEIIKRSPEMKEILKRRVEIRIDPISRIPKSSFFLTKDINMLPTALVYFYADKMTERSPTGQRGNVNFGVLIKEGEDSLFNLNYSFFQNVFREAWSSKNNYRIPVEDLFE